MSLGVGARLGHYSVTAKLGEGGMGEVWRATDTQLNRDVALKILPEAFATDPDRLARFQREARVLASLNHPGIAAIYGIEEQDDTRALVLELVEGPTLADRISKGPIPLDEALPIAKQIAEALEAAHEAGVIHRDLKPANIKVREDGTVKVLDFGLAKALDPNPTGDPSQSPTLTAAATQMGVIMGTAAYMSPEQARGKPVDRRSDIWSFGAVLYEMLTAERLFGGRDVSETLGAVLRLDPDWDALPDDAPPHLSALLERCLQKEPRQRLHHAADIRLVLEGAFEQAQSPVGAAGASQTRWRRALPLVLSASAITAAMSGLAVWLATQPATSAVIRLGLPLDAGEPLQIAAAAPDLAISPDGERVAYIVGDRYGGGRLHVRSLDESASEILVPEGPLYSPFFSPDGESVGFFDRTRPLVLKSVPSAGGSISTICELESDLRGATWGDDGHIIFGQFGSQSGLWRVSATGGEPEQLTTPNVSQGEIDHVYPQILPGGQAVLFTITAERIEESLIAVLSLDTLEHTVLLRGGSYPRYSPTGHVLYGMEGTLFAVGFDRDRLETLGSPVSVQQGLLTKGQGAANFDLSASGSLIYTPGSFSPSGERRLVWVNRQGEEEEIGVPSALYTAPRISPDGRYVAVEVMDQENMDVVVFDLQRDIGTRLTIDPGADSNPLWTPDGQSVVFSSDRGEGTGIYQRRADGTGQAELLVKSDAILGRSRGRRMDGDW